MYNEKNKEIVNKILESIQKNKKIIILRHIIPDGDAYGFQFGLRKIINLNWPDKIVKISGTENPDLNFIGNDFDDITDDDFKESLIIIGDTANMARIDEPTGRWKTGKEIIKIDHHPNNEPYGNIVYVRDDCCAASEALAEIIMENNLRIDAEAAKIIYHGIVTDSHRFLLRYPKPRTFKLAGFLLEQGFDLENLYETMYEQKPNELQFVAHVYQNYITTKEGVAYIFLSKDTLKRFDITADRAGYDYVKLLGNIKGSPISVFFCEYENGIVKVELRSTKLVINTVASKFGGGGHKTSAGIRLENSNLINDVLNDLDKVVKGENINV